MVCRNHLCWFGGSFPKGEVAFPTIDPEFSFSRYGKEEQMIVPTIIGGPRNSESAILLHSQADWLVSILYHAWTLRKLATDSSETKVLFKTQW